MRGGAYCFTGLFLLGLKCVTRALVIIFMCILVYVYIFRTKNQEAALDSDEGTYQSAYYIKYNMDGNCNCRNLLRALTSQIMSFKQ